MSLAMRVLISVAVWLIAYTGLLALGCDPLSVVLGYTVGLAVGAWQMWTALS